MELLGILLLSLSAFFAGVLDASVGGGGLVLVPAITFLTPLSLVSALASTRLAFTADSIAGIVAYKKLKSFKLTRELVIQAFLTLVGAGIGSTAVSQIDSQFFTKYYGVFVILVLLLFWFKPRQFQKSTEHSPFSPLLFLMVGVLIGVFGGGLTTLSVVIMTSLLGYSMINAISSTQLITLTGNLAALITFLYLGKVDFAISILTAVLAAAGALTGVRFAFFLGEYKLRVLFMIVAFLFALKLLLS